MATQMTSVKDYQDWFNVNDQTLIILPLDVPKYGNVSIRDSVRLAANNTRAGDIHIDEPNLFDLLDWAYASGNGRLSDGLSRVQLLESPIAANDAASKLIARQKQKARIQPHLEAVQWIKDATGFNQERVGLLIGVTRQTIDGWKKGTPISDVHRRRLFAVREVLERAASNHGTKELLVTWLDTPRGSDGRTPAQLLEANEINKARLLAMSSPSSRLVRAPSWVKQTVPQKFQTRAERRQEAVPPDPDKALDAFIDNED